VNHYTTRCSFNKPIAFISGSQLGAWHKSKQIVYLFYLKKARY